MFPPLEGCARGLPHHSSPSGFILPSKKASERLPQHLLGPGAKHRCTMVLCSGLPQFLPPPGSISKGGGSSSQRKHETSSDCPQHHPGLAVAHTAQQAAPPGQKGIRVPSSPTCSPLLPASFQGGTSILVAADCSGSFFQLRMARAL